MTDDTDDASPISNAEPAPRGAEETLDPASWDELRALGHRMVDDVFDTYERLRELPVWQPMPPQLKAKLHVAIPMDPQGAAHVYADFLELIAPYVARNTHPRWFGWVSGNGTGLTALAEFLVGALNCSVDGFDDVGTHLEGQVIDWCKTMLGYRPEGSGVLVSGSSMANLVGIAVARNNRPDRDVKRAGLTDGARLTLFASTETHSSVRRAAQLLGLGADALRTIQVDADYRIDVGELERAIERDKAAGFEPFCIVGNAGTVNTGATDDLVALAAVAKRQQLWLHVDGAFGACAAVSPKLRSLVAGLELADSIAFDLHKWMYFPYEAGCVLVRSDSEHRDAFSYAATYMAPESRGLAAATGKQFTEYGPQLSRSFHALKIWMGLKEHGIAKYGRIIEQNVRQAKYLASLVETSPVLELLAPVPLNIVCFRYVGPANTTVATDELNALNRELLAELQESGVAVPSHTVLDGRFVIRAAITNHRSTWADFDLTVRTIEDIGGRLLAAFSR